MLYIEISCIILSVVIVCEAQETYTWCQRKCCPYEFQSTNHGATCTCGSRKAPRGACACSDRDVSFCQSLCEADETSTCLPDVPSPKCACLPFGSGESMGSCERHCCPFAVANKSYDCQCSRTLAPKGACNCLKAEVNACRANCGTEQCIVDMNSLLCGCYEGQTPGPGGTASGSPCQDWQTQTCGHNCLLGDGTNAYSGCSRDSTGTHHCFCYKYQ